MAKYTPSIAKNQMRRCLRAIIDPVPTDKEVSELWEYFRSECAYCGVELSRNKRDGQLDHIEPQSTGGSNSIFNNVLSCGACNGDHKRDMNWELFLAQKALSIDFQKTRFLHIQGWLSRQTHRNLGNADLIEKIEAVQIAATESFDLHVEMMRNLRRQLIRND
jgi:HNH endonuclease